MRPHTPQLEGSPHSWQLEKSPHSNKDPALSKNKYFLFTMRYIYIYTHIYPRFYPSRMRPDKLHKLTSKNLCHVIPTTHIPSPQYSTGILNSTCPAQNLPSYPPNLLFFPESQSHWGTHKPPCRSNLVNLGVSLDSSLSLISHIHSITKS